MGNGKEERKGGEEGTKEERKELSVAKCGGLNENNLN